MGCSSGKSKRKIKNAETLRQTLAPNTELARLLRSIHASVATCTPAVKRVEVIVLYATLAEVLARKRRRPPITILRELVVIAQKMELTPLLTEKSFRIVQADVLLRKLLQLWMETAKSGLSITGVEAASIYKGLRLSAEQSSQAKLENILQHVLHWKVPEELESTLQEAMGDAEVLNATENPGSASHLSKDVIASYGGALTRGRFACHSCSSLTNGAFSMAGDEILDDTHSIFSYRISTITINTEGDLITELDNGTSRALVIPLRDPLALQDGTPFASIIPLLQSKAFVRSTLPLLLIFTPLPPELQGPLAAALTSHHPPLPLQSCPALSGHTASSHSITLRSLRNKILVASPRGPLRSGIGFFAADMARKGIGIRITGVQRGSSAAAVGLTKGDWITHLNGEQLDTVEEFSKQVQQFKMGDRISLCKENLTTIDVRMGAVPVEGGQEQCGVSPELSALSFFRTQESTSSEDYEEVNEWILHVLRDADDWSNAKRHDHQLVLTTTPLRTNKKHQEWSIDALCQVHCVDPNLSKQMACWCTENFVQRSNGTPKGFRLLKHEIDERVETTRLRVVAGPWAVGLPSSSTTAATKSEIRYKIIGSGLIEEDGEVVWIRNHTQSSVLVMKCLGSSGKHFKTACAVHKLLQGIHVVDLTNQDEQVSFLCQLERQ